MEGSELNGQLRASSERIHHQRPSAPKPPKPYGSVDKENEGTHLGGKKPSNAKDRPTFPPKATSEGGHGVLTRAGETILETFYGMLYKCDDDTKEWKLAADGFIPLCFIQEQGNANKPFKVIAVHGSTRVLEFPVTKDTKCTQNKAFVRWNESSSNMFGARFSKEGNADQFYSAMSRMKSTLLKTSELFKQPERKAMVSQMSDRTVGETGHKKTSLIVKLPNKETTVMSVPGLMTMGELFEHVCKKEDLAPSDHQLSLPKVGSKELKFEQDTVLGTLKIREISINYIGRSSNDSVMGDHESFKENKASAATAPVIPQPYSKQDERPTTKQTPTVERKTEQVEKSKNSPLVKPDPGKVKRRAPPPPKRPPERPKSMPVVRPRTVPSGPTASPGPPQPKKRQAPSRPPAPKILRDAQSSSTSDMKRAASAERLPPIFCPPPPPDDVPPPLDECENPVSPLSEEDLHDTAWMTSSIEHEPGEVISPSDVSPNKTEEPEFPEPRKPSLPSESDDAEDPNFVSPEPIPLKFLLPSSEAPSENPDDEIEREVSSRISFVGDSRSSSVDIASDADFPTSPILEGFKSVDPSMELNENISVNTDVITTEQEPESISPPPPPAGFSSEPLSEEVTLDKSENLESSEYEIESMVIPPPPVMFDDSTEPQDAVSKESHEAPDNNEVVSIPPPSDFASQDEMTSPPAEFGDEETLGASKKKLGLDSNMFPWLTESQPVFKAEITTSTMESQPVREIPNEKSVDEEQVSYGGVDVPMHEVPLLEKDEKLEITPSNKHDMSAIRGGNGIETSDLHKDIESQQLMEFDSNLESPSKVEADQVVPEAQEIPAPTTFKEEHLLVNKESHRSSESSSSSFKTPFDDLESIEYSEGSLNSETEEDIFDVKVTAMKDKESHAEVINQEQRPNNAVVSDSVKLEPSKEKKAGIKIETKEHQSEELTKNEVPEFVKHDELKGEKDRKSSKELVGSDSIVTTNAVSATSSGNNAASEEIIESSAATPIAIPVDILFQSLGSNTNSEVSGSQGDDKNKAQTRPGHKRSVGSGFKTQSWADIKNREKEIEKQRQQSITKDVSVSSEHLSSSITAAGFTKTPSMESSQLQKEKEAEVEESKTQRLADIKNHEEEAEKQRQQSITKDVSVSSSKHPSSSSTAAGFTKTPSMESSQLPKEKEAESEEAHRLADIKSREEETENFFLRHRHQSRTPNITKETSVSPSHHHQSSSAFKFAVQSKPSNDASIFSTASTRESGISPSTAKSDLEAPKSISLASSSSVISQTNDKVPSTMEVANKSKSTTEYSKSSNTSSSISEQSYSKDKSSHSSQSTSKSGLNSPTLKEKYSFTAETRKPSYVESARSQTTLLPSMLESSKKSTATEVVKNSQSTISPKQGVNAVEPKKPSYVASAQSKDVSSKPSFVETPQEKPEVVNKDAPDEKSSSSQNVAMRQKTERQDSVEKRKSVHDMMKMFQHSASQDIIKERSDSSEGEGVPRQSPALRLIEEKVNYPSQRRSSSGTTETTKTTDSKPSENERDSEESLVRQSPAMRLLEDKMGYPMNRASSKSSFSTTKSSTSDSKSFEEENNNSKESAKPPNETEKVTSEQTESSSLKGPKEISSDTRQRTSSINQRKSYGILFPREYKPSHSVKTSAAKPRETETANTKPRTNSLSNPRQKYDVLFPKEQQTQSNSVEANISVESKKQDASTTDRNLKETKHQTTDEKISIRLHEETKTIDTVKELKHKHYLEKETPKSKSQDKKEIVDDEKSKQRRSVDENILTKSTSKPIKDDTQNTDVVMRRKDSLTTGDVSKRHSMPVHLMDSASSSQTKSGGNLKILMAPQISDVDVVPKGRVAAMMAAWKKDDSQQI